LTWPAPRVEDTTLYANIEEGGDQMRGGWRRWALLTAVSVAVLVHGAPVTSAKVLGPNGRIAFSREIPGLDGLATYTVDPDGTDAARLLRGAAELPRWSPDGSEIAVLSCRNPPDCTTALAVADPDAGEIIRWFESPDPDIFIGCVTWSPDGDRLACAGLGNDDPALNGIYSIDATDGTALTRITSNPGGEDMPGDYSPNGRRIVFLRTDPDRPARRSQALFIGRVDRSVRPHRITPWGLSEETGSWSPDGQTILFSGAGILYTVAVPGGRMRRIRLAEPGAAFDPVWSPNGRRITFALYRPATSQSDIWTARADGRRMQRVTRTKRSEHFPDWGPSMT
jgi:Tol biopolymer transport system component